MTKQSVFWKIMLLLYLGAVAYLCFATQDGLPKLTEWKFPIPPDKCVHFAMFIPWPILSCLAVKPIGGRSAGTVLLLLGMTLLGFAIAGVTEWIQGMLPYRSKDINDLIADSLGLCSGALLFAAFYPFLQRSKTR